MTYFKVGDFVMVKDLLKTRFRKEEFLRYGLDINGVHKVIETREGQIFLEGDGDFWVSDSFEKVEVSSSLGDLL